MQGVSEKEARYVFTQGALTASCYASLMKINLMEQPIKLPCGHIFERTFIEKWKKAGLRCLVDGKEITTWTEAKELQEEVNAFLEKKAEEEGFYLDDERVDRLCFFATIFKLRNVAFNVLVNDPTVLVQRVVENSRTYIKYTGNPMSVLFYSGRGSLEDITILIEEKDYEMENTELSCKILKGTFPETRTHPRLSLFSRLRSCLGL